MMDDYLVYNPYTHEKKRKNLKDIPKYFGIKMEEILDQLAEGNYYFEHPDLYLLPEDISAKAIKAIYINHPHEGEAWRAYDDRYSISSHGRVMKHLKTKDFIMTPYRKKHQYRPYVVVKIHGKEVKVARLVMTVYHDESIDGLSVSHIDQNMWNNYYENLRVLSKEQHGKVTGTLANTSHPVELLDEAGQPVNWYRSIREAARQNFLSHQAISDHLHGITKTAAGLTFRRVREY